ncbi:YkvA family protein [Marinobacter caseinilyticus]|uniref:YkvA family protein n=1 Tax=Marinobacter caseinilyticus TaxID=2692195 RepID=UPI00140E24DD|nr:YkvA family protein [Marinobacter caseinilyticus]
MNSSKIKRQAGLLRQQSLTVYFAARDPRMPLPVRLLALVVAAYAISPIDLIPDVIPVIGYLDDIIIIPLGLALIIRLTPPEIIVAARRQAESASQKPVSYAAAAVIIILWVLALLAISRWLYQLVFS